MPALLLPPPPTDLDDDLTCRRFVGGAGAALAALLAGCSGSVDPTPSAEASSGFQRTVVHDKGATVVPMQPQRVYVAGSSRDRDCLLSLGVVPAVVGMYGGSLRSCRLLPGVADVPTVEAYEPDVERLASLRSDLGIINQTLRDEAAGERIRALTPSVAMPESGDISAYLAGS